MRYRYIISLLYLSISGWALATAPLEFYPICPPQLSPPICSEKQYENVDEKFCARAARNDSLFQNGSHRFNLNAPRSMSVPHERAHIYRHLAIVGRRARLSGATDVKIVDPNHFVSMSFGAREIYLWHFDLSSGQADIVTSATATFGGVASNVDLLDWDPINQWVTASHYLDGAQSIYHITVDPPAITQIAEYRMFEPIKLGKNKTKPRSCHSSKFVPGHPHLLIGTSVLHKHYATGIYDTEKKELLYSFADDNSNWHAQDTEVIDENLMAVAYTRGHVFVLKFYHTAHPFSINEATEPRCIEPFRRKVTGGSQVPVFDMKLAIYAINSVNPTSHKVLCEIEVTNSTCDSIVHHNGLLYVSDQYNDVVNIFKLVLLAPGECRMEAFTSITGYHMPHGVDIAHGMIAVTNYGDNSVKIMELPS